MRKDRFTQTLALPTNEQRINSRLLSPPKEQTLGWIGTALSIYSAWQGGEAGKDAEVPDYAALYKAQMEQLQREKRQLSTSFNSFGSLLHSNFTQKWAIRMGAFNGVIQDTLARLRWMASYDLQKIVPEETKRLSIIAERLKGEMGEDLGSLVSSLNKNYQEFCKEISTRVA